MNGYEALADLPLTVTSAEARRHDAETTSDFRRVTTEIRLEGPNHVGCGEDVTYETSHHDSLAETGLPPLEGEYDLGTFADILGDLDTFPNDAPERPAFRHYRRWGFESAALDLALRQADETLASALGGSYDPVRFLVSTRLGNPPSTERVERLLAGDSALEFKLDATADWDASLVDDLAATDAVRTVDLKGQYEGTEVDTEPDADLYRTVLEGFPDAVVEDPGVTEDTEPVLADEWDRIAWDAPVHDVSDLEDLPDVGWLNVKPSRFGSIESLLAAFEYCEREDADCYVGGQFELGPGREHLHALASLFCPVAPNDVAPVGYNDPTYDGQLPSSPLSVPDSPRGLVWSR